MDIGVIEGFYGAPWGRQDRLDLLGFLARSGFSFYLYAPKADAHLRRRWSEPHPDPRHLRKIGRRARREGLRWGVGLSPKGIDRGDASVLVDRARALEDLGIDHLALLFDDMPGHDRLAEVQAELVVEVANRTSVALSMCPSYYCDDPVLDLLFGERPPRYLEDLGRSLPGGIDIWWTGPAVISESYPAEHLGDVAARLGRKPLIWDNYPVNDGPLHCDKLRLQPVTGRSALREGAVGVAANPMNQPWLSRIALSTLAGDLEGSPTTLEAALAELLPERLVGLLTRDAARFAEGLGTFVPLQVLPDYDIDHPAAREVSAWLRGETAVGPEVLAV